MSKRRSPTIDLAGRVCLVSGANSGIGLEVARQLAGMGAEVTLLCRDRARGAVARAAILESAPGASVELLVADMSEPQQIRDAARQFRGTHDRLDILVNNAGAVFPERRLAANGVEWTFAVNHLGYFVLTTELLDMIEASAPARIVNVSSIAHRRAQIDFDDPGFIEGWSTMNAYRRSKLANVLFTYELARRLDGRGVTVNAIHPGLVATSFGSGVRWIRWVMRPVSRFLTQPSAAGAAVVRLAVDPALEGVTSRYFNQWDEERSSDLSHDAEVQRRLWDVSEELVAEPD